MCYSFLRRCIFSVIRVCGSLRIHKICLGWWCCWDLSPYLLLCTCSVLYGDGVLNLPLWVRCYLRLLAHLLCLLRKSGGCVIWCTDFMSIVSLLQTVAFNIKYILPCLMLWDLNPTRSPFFLFYLPLSILLIFGFSEWLYFRCVSCTRAQLKTVFF